MLTFTKYTFLADFLIVFLRTNEYTNHENF